MGTIINRIKAPTPSFWKKVQKACIGVGVISGAITTAIASGGIALPASIATVFGYMTAIGAFGAGLSQLTVDDNKDAK